MSPYIVAADPKEGRNAALMTINAIAFPRVLRFIRIAPKVLARDRRSNGRRSLGSSDSLSLVDHRATITPKTGPTANVYRHDPNRSSVCPRIGASVGTIKNTVRMIAIARAKSSPVSYTHLTLPTIYSV